MTTPEWIEAHKGPLRRVVGHVWYCGDEECNCSQAVIEEEYENKVDRRFIVPVRVWEGEFHTDGEGDPDSELAAERERLQRDDPERESLIQWQVNRSLSTSASDAFVTPPAAPNAPSSSFGER